MVRLGALLLILGSLVMLAPAPASAQVVPSQWGLTSFCTPSQDFPEFRRFRVTNNTGAAQPATLFNQTFGGSNTFDASTGQSFHNVPANPTSPSSANTTQLRVQGVTVNTKAANNKACSDLVGSAVCDTSNRRYDITWTLKNNGTGPSTIVSNTRGLTFSPTTLPANAAATATEQVAAPASGSTVVTLSVEVDLGSSVIGNPEASVTLGECGDPIPPVIDFTFTKTPNVVAATVGQVVTYTYAGTNTGTVPLEITQLVDDSLGVVISDPSVETIVQPGGSISRPVTYTVTANDASVGRIDNSAVVTVVPRSGPDQTPKSGVASAVVNVPSQPNPIPGLAGTAVCDPGAGQFTVTWLLGNTGGGPETVSTSSRPGTFTPGTVVASGQTTSVAEVVAAPAAGTTAITLTVEFVDAPTVSATLTLGECRDPITPEVSFTFTKTADRDNAVAGETVTYLYAGTNTGSVTLEVVQLVDDQLGVLIEDPTVRTLVAPGESISRQVTYVVTPNDASFGSIFNTAGVLVVPDGQTRRLTAVAQENITVGPILPVVGPRDAGTIALIATLLIGAGLLLLTMARPAVARAAAFERHRSHH